MTMTTEKTLEGVAGELYATFNRDNPRGVWSTDDDRATDIAHAAHEAGAGSHMPCDWHYAAVHSALAAIADGSLVDDDDVHEWADGEVDVYNSARHQWLVDCGHYDDSEVAEFEPTGDIDTLIGVAQYVELRSIGYTVLQGVRELVDADDEGDES